MIWNKLIGKNIQVDSLKGVTITITDVTEIEGVSYLIDASNGADKNIGYINTEKIKYFIIIEEEDEDVESII